MADSKEITKLSFSEINTRGILNPLVSFDCLIDIDFGLLVLIAQNFFDTSVFSAEFFKDNDNIENMKWTIYDRPQKNPLTLCLKDVSLADDYYNQFMDQYYADILDRSMITDLANLLPNLATSGATFSILCNNKLEYELLDKIPILKDYTRVLLSDIVEPDKYHQFFIKDFDDKGMHKYAHLLRDKNIYIARYKFNVIEDMDKIDERFKTYAILDNMRCNITKFDLYSRRKEDNSTNE